MSNKLSKTGPCGTSTLFSFMSLCCTDHSSRFAYKTPCKDDRRARYVCKDPACWWRVAGSRRKDGQIIVRVTHREHTCNKNQSTTPTAARAEPPLTDGSSVNPYDPAYDPELVGPNQLPVDAASTPVALNGISSQPKKTKRQAASHVSWLAGGISKVLEVTTNTRPADIIKAAATHYNENLNYQQAFRCLRLLTAPIKERGHRERVPDELRKAIVTLRVFLDPPMDFIEIERRTGVKARTAGYIWQSTERKAGGSRDPMVLLRCASVQQSGPRGGKTREQRKQEKLVERKGVHGIFESFPTAQGILSSKLGEPGPLPKRTRKPQMRQEGMHVSVELARAAAELDDDDEEDEMDLEEDEDGGEGVDDEEESGLKDDEMNDVHGRIAHANNGPDRQLQAESSRADPPSTLIDFLNIT